MPKHYMLARHRVADFLNWKKVYDANKTAREGAGFKELHLLRNTENQNDITLLFEIEDIEKAKAFLNSPDSQAKRKEARIEGTPEIYFLLEH